MRRRTGEGEGKRWLLLEFQRRTTRFPQNAGLCPGLTSACRTTGSCWLPAAPSSDCHKAADEARLPCESVDFKVYYGPWITCLRRTATRAVSSQETWRFLAERGHGHPGRRDRAEDHLDRGQAFLEQTTSGERRDGHPRPPQRPSPAPPAPGARAMNPAGRGGRAPEPRPQRRPPGPGHGDQGAARVRSTPGARPGAGVCGDLHGHQGDHRREDRMPRLQGMAGLPPGVQAEAERQARQQGVGRATDRLLARRAGARPGHHQQGDAGQAHPSSPGRSSRSPIDQQARQGGQWDRAPAARPWPPRSRRGAWPPAGRRWRRSGWPRQQRRRPEGRGRVRLLAPRREPGRRRRTPP